MFWLQRFRFEALIKKHPGRYIQHLRYKVLIKLTVQQHPGRDNSYRTGSFLIIGEGMNNIHDNVNEDDDVVWEGDMVNLGE